MTTFGEGKKLASSLMIEGPLKQTIFAGMMAGGVTAVISNPVEIVRGKMNVRNFVSHRRWRVPRITKVLFERVPNLLRIKGLRNFIKALVPLLGEI